MSEPESEARTALKVRAGVCNQESEPRVRVGVRGAGLKQTGQDRML